MHRFVSLAHRVAAVAAAAVFAAVSLHSVQEIHYLKGFYPDRFTVAEAFWAAGVEVIKVALVGLALLAVVRALAVVAAGDDRRQ